jgi:hypothetical protein
MSIGIDEPTQHSAATLVTGILGDLQSLVQQQFSLTVREVELELRRRTKAGIVIGVGVGLLLVGAVAFSMAAANLVHWASCPAGTDAAWLPLWACHAVVSLGFAIAGGVTLFVGRRRLQCSTGCRVPAIEFSGEKKNNGRHN